MVDTGGYWWMTGTAGSRMLQPKLLRFVPLGQTNTNSATVGLCEPSQAHFLSTSRLFQNLCFPQSESQKPGNDRDSAHSRGLHDASLWSPRTGANTLHIHQPLLLVVFRDSHCLRITSCILMVSAEWRLTPRQQLWDTVPWSQIASVGSVGLAQRHVSQPHSPRGRVPNDYSGQSHSSWHFLCRDLRHSAHGLLADCHQMRSIPSFQVTDSDSSSQLNSSVLSSNYCLSLSPRICSICHMGEYNNPAPIRLVCHDPPLAICSSHSRKR